jgi:cell division protein FtsZ
MSKATWLRFAGEAAARWFRHGGVHTPEFVRFGGYLRARRYHSGVSLAQLASEVDVPYEHLALLEQGLLRPSEVRAQAWVRLMRLLEGRESMAPAVTPAAASGPAAQASPPGPVAQPAALAKIKVIGVGGGGTNAVSRMYRSAVPGVEYAALNTDAQHLARADLPQKIQLGEKLTRGLGVGGSPAMGREAAEESRGQLEELVSGYDMVFIAAGMGGGTGTGAAPVVAGLAKESGALTIAVVTKPFSFEGGHRVRQAEEGIARLKDAVDTLIVIPNDRLLRMADKEMTADNAFKLADEVLQEGVQSIAELVNMAGEINLDFADVRAIMSGAGPAWIGIGTGRGQERALTAARAAIASPLLDAPIEGARRVLLNITGGADLAMQEVRQAADYVSGKVDPEANIIFGMVIDPQMEDEVQVTVIATGLVVAAKQPAQPEALEKVLQASVGPMVTKRPPANPFASFFKMLRGSRPRGGRR